MQSYGCDCKKYVLEFEQVHQWEKLQFSQSRLVTAIKYVFSGITLKLFKVQYIFHQKLAPQLSAIRKFTLPMKYTNVRCISPKTL